MVLMNTKISVYLSFAKYHFDQIAINKIIQFKAIFVDSRAKTIEERIRFTETSPFLYILSSKRKETL